MTVRRAAAALLGSAVLLALTGCGTDGGPEPTSADVTTSDAPTSEAPSEDPTDDGPPFPEGTARQSTENSGEWDLVLSEVRVGEHEGFDRIVLEFTGTGTPGWTVNYVDEAVLDGSGEVVQLGGDAFLDIYASGTTYPESEQDYYAGPRQFQSESGGGVDEVYVAGTFEGYTQVLAGIDGDRVPFRVFALSDPSRLVVDVRDNG
jgi:predicted small lipoprotein YifL